MRMLLVKRRYITAKIGTILFQSVYRGHATRRLLAAIKIQTQFRRHKYHIIYIKLKSATISLQCRQRRGMAKKVLVALKHEQKDIGKLKQNNEKLKSEMASLKAMLAAQAKQGAMKVESEKELLEKEAEIKQHVRRIKTLEDLLEKEKENVKQIEIRLEDKELMISEQQEKITVLTQQNQNLTLHAPSSPRKTRSASSLPSNSSVIGNDDHALEEARAQVASLEKALEDERAARRETYSEVIKLRAQASGITLGDGDDIALLPSEDDIKSTNALPVLDTNQMDSFDSVDSDDR